MQMPRGAFFGEVAFFGGAAFSAISVLKTLTYILSHSCVVDRRT